METIKSVLSILTGLMLAFFLSAALFSVIPKEMPQNTDITRGNNNPSPPVQTGTDIKVPQFYKLTDDLIARFIDDHIVAFGKDNPMKFYHKSTEESDSKPIANNPQAQNASSTANNRNQTANQNQISGYVLPVDKDMLVISSPYGMRKDPFTKEWAMHNGIDISTEGIEGKPVYAFLGGKVLFAGEQGDHGNSIVIDHGNCQTTYNHLKSIDPSVKPGETVSTGQVIGLVGNTGRTTGPHLHFELAVNGMTIDPLPYLIAKIISG